MREQSQIEKAIADIDEMLDELIAELQGDVADIPDSAKVVLQTDVMQKRMGVIGQKDVPVDRQSYYDVVDVVSTLESDGEGD